MTQPDDESKLNMEGMFQRYRELMLEHDNLSNEIRVLDKKRDDIRAVRNRYRELIDIIIKENISPFEAQLKYSDAELDAFHYQNSITTDSCYGKCTDSSPSKKSNKKTVKNVFKTLMRNFIWMI